jgi:DNA-binding HxlR family transcriptional regulator
MADKIEPGPAPIPRPTQVFDPVARALDLIGERWKLVLIGHLLRGPKGFQDLRVRTGITPRVLSTRLRQLGADGFVRSVEEEGRSLYAATERARQLAPIVSAVARWWVLDAVEDHERDFGGFTESSPLSILESLPFLLREEPAREADVTFEIRLTGRGGGVWVVHIDHGTCTVREGFAEHADVRYTADARVWCRLALGLFDGGQAFREGLLKKDGSREAMDTYFYQVAKPDPAAAPDPSSKQRSQS